MRDFYGQGCEAALEKFAVSRAQMARIADAAQRMDPKAYSAAGGAPSNVGLLRGIKHVIPQNPDKAPDAVRQLQSMVTGNAPIIPQNLSSRLARKQGLTALTQRVQVAREVADRFSLPGLGADEARTFRDMSQHQPQFLRDPQAHRKAVATAIGRAREPLGLLGMYRDFKELAGLPRKVELSTMSNKQRASYRAEKADAEKLKNLALDRRQAFRNVADTYAENTPLMAADRAAATQQALSGRHGRKQAPIPLPDMDAVGVPDLRRRFGVAWKGGPTSTKSVSGLPEPLV
jgi:hypothetical protein